MKILSLIIILTLALGVLTSCGGNKGDVAYDDETEQDSITILGEKEIIMELGDTLKLEISASSTVGIVWESSTDAVLVGNGVLYAEKCGSALITVTLGDAFDIVSVTVINPDGEGDYDDVGPEGPFLPID